mgnify:CR=1 FL=1
MRQNLADALSAADLPELKFVEVHPENYVRRGGRFRTLLARARERWPVLTHGLTLQYNKARQAAITREVSEITGGMEAMAS